MAEFCTQCLEELLCEPGHASDFMGLSTVEDTLQEEYAVVLCEGCGVIQVDHTGRCVSPDCEKQHGKCGD